MIVCEVLELLECDDDQKRKHQPSTALIPLLIYFSIAITLEYWS